MSRTLHRWCDRKKWVEEPVFTGYVFCQFDPHKRLPVLDTQGVLRILGFGRDATPLDPAEIAALQALERAKPELEAWPYLYSGQPVQITKGPLTGVQGAVATTKSGLRVVISVSLLRRSVAVEVDQSQIRPLSLPHKSLREHRALAV